MVSFNARSGLPQRQRGAVTQLSIVSVLCGIFGDWGYLDDHILWPRLRQSPPVEDAEMAMRRNTDKTVILTSGW